VRKLLTVGRTIVPRWILQEGYDDESGDSGEGLSNQPADDGDDDHDND